jgi:hypothetical protein
VKRGVQAAQNDAKSDVTDEVHWIEQRSNSNSDPCSVNYDGGLIKVATFELQPMFGAVGFRLSMVAALFAFRNDVCVCHVSDMPTDPENVRYSAVDRK